MKYLFLILLFALTSSCLDLKSSQAFPSYNYDETNEIWFQKTDSKKIQVVTDSIGSILNKFKDTECYITSQEKLDDFYEEELGFLTFIGKSDSLHLEVQTSDTYDDRVIATFTTSNDSFDSRVETINYHRFYIKKECYDSILNLITSE
jgi:hypothetical protein